MHIYVDADACPVIGIVERIAKSHNIAVTLLCDTNHYLTSDYSEVVYVGAGADAVDFKLISLCEKGDLVVTQDYGVAAMALSKGAYAIHQSGKWYTNENIDLMLMERHISKKARRASSKNDLVHTVPTQASVIILGRPSRSARLTMTTGRGYSIFPGFQSCFPISVKPHFRYFLINFSILK